MSVKKIYGMALLGCAIVWVVALLGKSKRGTKKR